MKTEIVVNLQVEGTHRWEGCDIPPVMFLKNQHRHIFHITCWRQVGHNDRQIEFIQYKAEITAWLYSKYGRPCHFDRSSCEHIATELVSEFSLSKCQVMEDGENGANVEA